MDGCWTEADRARVLDDIADGLWRYVARHARDVEGLARAVADLTGMPAASLTLLRHLRLVLSGEIAGFVEQALPTLLHDLRPVAPPHAALTRGPIHGPIAWGATVAARARSGGADQTLYVTAAPGKEYSTAGARLLARLVGGALQSCQILHEQLGDAMPAGWMPAVTRVRDALARAQGDAHLARVGTDPPRPGDLGACRRSPRPATRALARTYTFYHELVEKPTSAALLDALAQQVLIPLDDDALYELWALIGAAATFDDAGWTLRAAGLAGRDAVPFSYLSPDRRATARLRFGHTPAHWRRHSRYRAVFERYGLAGATRRPDLIVDVSRGRRRRHVLVEVKRTRDPAYTADSVYKVLGYLADFEAVFATQEGTRALLLLWDGVVSLPADARATAEETLPHALVLATHRDYRARLHAILVDTLSRLDE